METNQLLKEDIQRFCGRIDIDYQVNFVREYEKIGDSRMYGGKHCGSDAEHKGSVFLAEKLKEIGLDHIELLPCKTSRYQFRDAALSPVCGGKEIKPYGYVSPGTESEGITAEIIDGDKSTKRVYENMDIKGKIVLIAAMGTLEGANLSGQIEEAVRSGAAAVLVYAVEEVFHDQTIRVQPPNIISPIPIVGISRKDAAYLQGALKRDPRQKYCLKVDAEFVPNGGTTYNVVGEISGSVSNEKIIYTAHLDHYFRCLQDNMSSCATLLGIAKALKDAGVKPNRTLVFAFHGSHEAGGMDTRYPYIVGSYKLTHENKKEWTGRAIANINFEYTALRQKKLSCFGYIGNNRAIRNYYVYAPELIGGFASINKTINASDYYMLSWSDCISYHTAGIPTFSNDPITEQMYEKDSPYTGRDHSNHDNWDIFDKQTLEDTARFYGGYGLFLDSCPYLQVDFSEQAARIKTEIDLDLLKTLGVPVGQYMESVNRMEQASLSVNRFIEQKNREYFQVLNQGLPPEEKPQWFDEGQKVNEKLLKCYKITADHLDKINAFDFLCLGTVKYTQNIRFMQEASRHLKDGAVSKAVECLQGVDLCQAASLFSEEVAEHMRKQISDPAYGDRRTWASGRELRIETHYRLINDLTSGKVTCLNNFRTRLEELILKEAGHIPKVMNQEMEALNNITEILKTI